MNVYIKKIVQLISNMNDKQKLFFLIGFVSMVMFFVLGIESEKWIIYDDIYISKPNYYLHSRGYKISWITFVPFLVLITSTIGFFLFKDK